jgi:hypothetical protein
MVVDSDLLIVGVQFEEILNVVFRYLDGWHNLVCTGEHNVSWGFLYCWYCPKHKKFLNHTVYRK